jgi:tetratricopeptide (TPR) repeat protein
LAWHGPHQARAHFNIGICQQRLGRLREAVLAYKQAIKLRDGRYPLASYALGLALQGLGEREQMVAAFLEAARGRHAEALFELAVEAQRSGQLDSAVAYYRRAIEVSQDRIPACHNNLGVIHAASGELDEARREFQLALKRSKNRMIEARENLERCRSASSPSLLAVSPARSLSCE